MRHIKKFNESNTTPNQNEIRETLNSIIWRTTSMQDIHDRIHIRPDGTIDVLEGDILIDNSQIENLPVKFGEVERKFELRDCNALTSLKGSPTRCGSFYVRRTPIKNLIGGPEYVEGVYNLDLFPSPRYSPSTSNILTSLEGAPKKAYIFCIEKIAKNLYDPRGLKGSDIKLLDLRNGCPILELMEMFSHMDVYYNTTSDTNQMKITERFIDSLDYGYIRGNEEEGISINLFRFKEALAEFDIKDPIPHPDFRNRKVLKNYNFIGEGGEIVDFDGNPTSFSWT